VYSDLSAKVIEINNGSASM